MVLRRIALPLINSFLITATLFAFMYSLIDMDEPELSSRIVLPPISFGHIPEDTAPEVLVAKIKPPKEVELPPEIPREAAIISPTDLPTTQWTRYEAPVFDRENGVPTDNQLVIAIGFPPEYPRNAIMREIEGYAVVGFSVSAAGSVVDPYVLESEPNKVFDKASIKAISKFKYKARVVNGKQVRTDGQRYMFTYKLDQ